jgi:transglutaminase-like putative cysteine protease
MPYLLTALVIGIAPHVSSLPPWIIFWTFSAFFYLMAGWIGNWPVPPRWLQLTLAVIAFSGVVIMSRGRSSSESGIGLLCLMAGLKPFEINTHRDRMATVFIAYFMVIASLFFSTSLGMAVYLFGSVTVITGILILINHPEAGIRKNLIQASTYSLQALPLALILFMIFPRLQGSLWGIKSTTEMPTGLSETLTPGMIAGMYQNNAIAFRVSFDRSIPLYTSMYWRALVFLNFDGQSWTRSAHTRPADHAAPGERPVSYSVVLQAHNQNWIPALDLPTVLPSGYELKTDHTVVSKETITKPIEYGMTSNLEWTDNEWTGIEELSLRLPAYGNPDSRILAERMRSDSGSDSAYVDAVTRMFRTQEFYYTLEPQPVSGQNSIDDFLFKTRKGYCENYASAFAFLMRAAGIPARIVGGYYGGELNPYGRYLIVRQANAHAWTEVLLPGKGWVRIDPTAAIDPQRIDADVRQVFDAERSKASGPAFGDGILPRLLKQAQLGWDSLNYQWTLKIIYFDTLKQKRFLDKFGLNLDTVSGILKTMSTGFALIALLLAAYHLPAVAGYRTKDPVTLAYTRFQKKLAALNIHKPSHMGRRDFAHFAGRIRPDLRKEITGIIDNYISITYGRHGNRELLSRDFIRRVRRFGSGKLG